MSLREIRIIPAAALVATCVAWVAFVTLHPTAAVWALVVALVLAICGLFTLAKEANDLAGELDARDATIADLRRAQLRVVPAQRTGAHDRVISDADYWLAIYDENGGHRG